MTPTNTLKRIKELNKKWFGELGAIGLIGSIIVLTLLNSVSSSTDDSVQVLTGQQWLGLVLFFATYGLVRWVWNRIN